jgi:hypothetical protein
MTGHGLRGTGLARRLLRAGTIGVAGALAWLALPAASGLAATAQPAAGTVSQATIQVSSLSASATDVSYTVSFASPGALTKGVSTITLDAPPGTSLPGASTGCYAVYDDSGGGAFGTSGCGAVTVSGTSAVITTPVDVAAGDPVSVIVAGVGNPASAGKQTLTVATSADTTATSLSYTLVAKRSVGHAALQVSSSSAGASGVTYSVSFASPDRLARDSLVTVTFPAGTVLPSSGGCSVVDYTDDTDGSGGCAGYTAAGTTATVTDLLTNPGDMTTITFAGVTSPGSAGTHDVTLSTTSDPEPVTLGYSLVAKRSVSDPFLQLSSYTAKASGVTWSVGFVAPDRLVDSGGTTSSSTVTIKAPAGTVLPAGGCGAYTFIDASPGGSGVPLNGCTAATVTGSSVTVTAGFTTNPGNTIFVVIKGVTNPATMSSLTVSTSADPGQVTLPLSHPTAMAATGQLSSTSATATKVLYAATFQSTGALASGSSTIKLDSAGATFPVCSASGQYIVIDDTTGADAGICPVGGSSPGPSITLAYGGQTTTAGNEITVLAYGVANSAAAGSGTFSVATLPSAGGASLPIDLTAPTSISSPVLSLVSRSAAATGLAVSATFRVANGFTVNGAGDDFSSIVVRLAAGTTLQASGFADVYNNSTGGGGGASYTSSGDVATLLPPSGGNMAAGPGDEITVVIFGAASPSSGGAETASLSTTSDPVPVAVDYQLTAKTSVSHDIVQLSSRKAGASGVTYSFTFQTANGLVSADNPGSAITVTLPAGTGMPPAADVAVADNTTGQSCGGVSAISGTTATVAISSGSCPQELGAGDVVTLVLSGVTNAPSLSGATIGLSTTSDPAPVTTAVP